MADNIGRRAVVTDPLASVALQPNPARPLPLMGVGPPSTGSNANEFQETGIDVALGRLRGAIDKNINSMSEEAVIDGKMQYMQGATEADMLRTGDRFTRQGYMTLKTRDDANRWFSAEQLAIADKGRSMEPDEYRAYINDRQRGMLEQIGDDPDARAIAVASFADLSPRLVTAHMEANNTWNHEQRQVAFGRAIDSTSMASVTASSREAGSPIALSNVQIAPSVNMTAFDRDVAIKTVLGEAAGEGALGQAAVAHVIRNRSEDSRWPSTVSGVSLQSNQFSAWNTGAGGNNPDKWGSDSAAYKRAGSIVDAVMSGFHADPTNGSTHYYSPIGMQTLVSDGSQGNKLPTWLAQELDRGNGGRIGGHIFAGKSSGRGGPRISPTATGASVGTVADLNAVPAAEGVADRSVVAAGGGTEVRELIRGYSGLNLQEKATGVASAMIRQLASGSDQLFRDAGGVGMLYELGADQATIANVEQAHRQWKTTEGNKFNADTESAKSSILADIKSGKINGEQGLARIQSLYDANDIDDNTASSLSSQVLASAAESEGSGVMANPEVREGLDKFYRRITAGEDALTVTKDAEAYAKAVGIPVSEFKGILGEMFSIQRNNRAKAVAEAEEAATKAAKEQIDINAVNDALGRGTGLNLLSGGTITVKNAQGQPEEINMQKYGVQVIRDKYIGIAKQSMQNGMPIAAAAAQAEMQTYRELARHNVIDEEAAQQLRASMSGNIMVDGKPSETATQAYAMWLTLKRDPQIPDEYLAKMTGDDYTRNILNMAETLDAGNLDLQESLTKAYELVNDPLVDPKARIDRDIAYNAEADTAINEALTEELYGTGFLSNFTLGDGHLARDLRQALSQSGLAKSWLNQHVDSYYLQAPHLPTEVHIRKAVEDLKGIMSIVGGNIIIGKDDKSPEQLLGIEAFGKTAVQDMVHGYLSEHGATIWPGEDWSGTNDFNPRISQIFKGGSHYSAHFDPNSLTMEFHLFKDAELKEEIRGSSRRINLKDMAKDYRTARTTPGLWDEMWSGLFSGTGAAIEGFPKPVDPGAINLFK